MSSMKESSSLKVISQSKTNKWWVFRLYWSTNRIFLLVFLCYNAAKVKCVFTLPWGEERKSLDCSPLAFYCCKISSPLWKTGLRWEHHQGETSHHKHMKKRCYLTPDPTLPSVKTMIYPKEKIHALRVPPRGGLPPLLQSYKSRVAKLQVPITHCQQRRYLRALWETRVRSREHQVVLSLLNSEETSERMMGCNGGRRRKVKIWDNGWDKVPCRLLKIINQLTC